MKKILLISMPFGALERPALGLSLLKARCLEKGMPCEVRYLSFTFADLIGLEEYQWISCALPYIAFAGDWTFTEALYGKRRQVDAEYEGTVLRKRWQLDEPSIERLRRVRALTAPFLEHCLSAISWDDYALVGFTSTFEQNLASLAFARKVKAAHPSIVTVFGGANWEAEMGLELHRQFDFVDYVCSGEADESFPALVDAALMGEPRTIAARLPPGIVYRRGRDSVSTGRGQPVRQMDSLPVPDFSDFFQQWSESSASLEVAPTLLLETSRGCWWGDKSHCTFCGLNGGTMAFRSKTAGRVLEEMRYLSDHWQLERVEVVDNILDMRYFADLLPAVAAEGRSWEIFFEVKANLSRKQVALLRAAGVNRIQPGIESLSDHILKLMRKGTHALRNIQLLKWCKEYGVGVDWNILYGFPGETQEDYAAMLALLPAIRFLAPPGACGPIRMDRFSPYFETPAAFGLTNVRPIEPYGFLYPFATESLERIAYYFDFDYEAAVDPAHYAGDVIAYAEAWRRQPDPGSLYAIVGSDGALLLCDTRQDATCPEVALGGLERAAYEYCDEFRALGSIVRYLTERFPSAAVSAAGVQGYLDSLVANRLMVTNAGSYLSLALHAAAAAGAPKTTEEEALAERPEPPLLAGTEDAAA